MPVSFMGWFRQRVERMYLCQCPYGREKLRALVSETLWKSLFTASVSAMGVLVWNICVEKKVSLYCLLSMVFAAYLSLAEVPERMVYRVEEEIYQGMLRYFASVKHHYLACHNIPNAVHDAAEEVPEELRLHAGNFYDILLGSERRERVREYVFSPDYNRYFKLFLIQAYEASEKGDMETLYSSSLFSENIEYLRTEIMQEIYRRRRRAYELSGYAFVAVAPVFTLSVLRNWGIGFTSELEAFYAGAGNCIVLLCFVVSLIVYSGIKRAREVTFAKERRSFIAEKMVDYRRVRRVLRALENCVDFGRLRKLLVQSGDYTSPRVLLLKMTGYAGGALVLVTVCCLALSRGMQWYEFLFVLLCTVLAAALPILELCYRRTLLLSGALKEVKQFQSVIWMERRLDGLTIPALLEDMEVFALVFRPVIRECINSYSAGPREALLRMKAAGSILHESFADLADGFLAVEEAGIAEAFAEVENNRMMLDKMSQLEAEIQLEKKKDNTDLISRVPVFLALGLYFILPFLWVSLSGVAEIFAILEELQY